MSSEPVLDIQSLMPPNTDLSGAPVVVEPPPFSIEDLMNAHQVVVAKENEDRALASNFANMSIDAIRPQLYAWATGGFQPLYKVNTLMLYPPATCSDGISRELVDYFLFLIGKTVEEWLNAMNAKTVGMHFTYSHDGYSRIHLYVNRT